MKKFELISKTLVSSGAASPRLRSQKVGLNIPRNLPLMGILSGIKEKRKNFKEQNLNGASGDLS